MVLQTLKMSLVTKNLLAGFLNDEVSFVLIIGVCDNVIRLNFCFIVIILRKKTPRGNHYIVIRIRRTLN